ncbi:MAG: DUF2147 domain-containing protein [Rhodothermaceae bacterium]
MKPVAIIIFGILINFLFAQDVTGKWKTIDHETGEAKSIVEIYKKDGKIYGKIVEVLNKENPEKLICDECPEPWKNQPIVGLVIINGFEDDGDGEWAGDDALFSPKKKEVYDGKLWREGDVLFVRGYLGWFHATQEWQKVKEK